MRHKKEQLPPPRKEEISVETCGSRRARFPLDTSGVLRTRHEKRPFWDCTLYTTSMPTTQTEITSTASSASAGSACALTTKSVRLLRFSDGRMRQEASSSSLSQRKEFGGMFFLCLRHRQVLCDGPVQCWCLQQRCLLWFDRPLRELTSVRLPACGALLV